MKWTLNHGRAVEIWRAIPLNVYKGKERKEISTGEKLYERFRLYADISEYEAEEKWYAISERDLNAVLHLLDIFAGIFDGIKLEIEISERSYPEMYKALRQYEEKGDTVWAWLPETPKIVTIILDFADGDVETIIKIYRINANIDELKKEAEKMVMKIREDIKNILKERLMIRDVEVICFAYVDHKNNLFAIRIRRIGEIIFYKHFNMWMRKEGEKYVLTISGEGGKLTILNSSISIV